MGNGLFFPSHGDALYGFHHPAEGGPRETGVVFVHGAFEERQDAHLVLRDAAARLAGMGFDVLRFDLYGHGDSAGEFRDATLARWVDDTLAACDALRRASGCARVALVGLRLGGAVATRAAHALTARGEETPRLVLWQPVVDGQRYVLDVLRAYLASEMVVHRRAGASRDELVARLRAGECVNVFGYHLSPALFDELRQLDLTRDLAASGANALVVDVTRAPAARGDAALDALAQAVATASLARVVEAQPLHTEGKLFVNRADEAFAATSRFLAASP